MSTKLSRAEFDLIYAKVPRLCIELVVKSEKGVLLTLRDIEPGKGFWHLPGGTVLFDESVDQTLERVAREELGLGIKSSKLLGLIDWWGSTTEVNRHTVSVAYLVELENGEIKLNFQSSKYDFFKEIPKKTLVEQKKFLEVNLSL